MSSLVSIAPVVDITGDPVISKLGWTVVVHQDQEEALAPVQAQTRAGLLLALGIVGLAAIGAVGMGQLLAGPITRLTAVAAKIIAGDLQAQAAVESNDQIGELAAAFNTMTRRMREIIDTLEHQVAQRTQRLETVVDVSRRLTGILDLSDLLRQVVTLTKETFDYYHVHIYLLEGDTLIMAEGYGEAGIQMKRQGHSIPRAAPQSLVARAAREGQVIIVENVRDDPDWLPNPLLPNTYSEMAVPVILGREVVGVLDVQSEEIGGLTEEDESTLETLANQVATAVRNARLFTETQEALYDAQRLQQLYMGQAWEKLSANITVTNYEVRQPALPPLEDIATPEVEAALQQAQTVDMRFSTDDALPSTALEPEDTNGKSVRDSQPEIQISRSGVQNAIATPLKLRGHIVGVLGVHTDDAARQWTQEEISLIEAVSEQMSLAIENARLFEETQQRAAREKIIADVTGQVWASDDLERIMQTAIEQLGVTLDASKVVIRLGTEEQLLSE